MGLKEHENDTGSLAVRIADDNDVKFSITGKRIASPRGKTPSCSLSQTSAVVNGAFLGTSRDIRSKRLGLDLELCAVLWAFRRSMSKWQPEVIR